MRFNVRSMSAPGSDPITTRLKTSRTDLLDLSLRNPLLNYTHPRASSLRMERRITSWSNLTTLV